MNRTASKIEFAAAHLACVGGRYGGVQKSYKGQATLTRGDMTWAVDGVTPKYGGPCPACGAAVSQSRLWDAVRLSRRVNA